MLFCGQKVKEKYFSRLIDILKALIDVCAEKLENTILLFLRNFFLTENNANKYNYILKFFGVIDKKKNILAEKCTDSLSYIFYKSLRLFSITMMHKECRDLQNILTNIIKFIWESHKNSKIPLYNSFKVPWF